MQMKSLNTNFLFKSLKIKNLKQTLLKKDYQLVGCALRVSLELDHRTRKSVDVQSFIISKWIYF